MNKSDSSIEVSHVCYIQKGEEGSLVLEGIGLQSVGLERIGLERRKRIGIFSLRGWLYEIVICRKQRFSCSIHD